MCIVYNIDFIVWYHCMTVVGKIPTKYFLRVFLRRIFCRSVRGTVRGVKNRVRAGIATFLQDQTAKVIIFYHLFDHLEWLGNSFWYLWKSTVSLCLHSFCSASSPTTPNRISHPFPCGFMLDSMYPSFPHPLCSASSPTPQDFPFSAVVNLLSHFFMSFFTWILSFL